MAPWHKFNVSPGRRTLEDLLAQEELVLIQELLGPAKCRDAGLVGRVLHDQQVGHRLLVVLVPAPECLRWDRVFMGPRHWACCDCGLP